MKDKTFNQLLDEYGEINQKLNPLLDRQKELKDQVKSLMESEKLEKMNNGKFSVSYITIISVRLNQKKAIDLLTPDQREQCIEDSESKRFQITEVKIKK